MSKNPYEICFVALPYATADLHLGRLMGSFLPADIYTRFVRSFKKTSCFLCSGLDCYGTNVYLESLKTSVHPKRLCDVKYQNLKRVLKTLDISLRFDFRTDRKPHKTFVRSKIDSLMDQKLVVLKQVKTSYCERCDMYLSDRLLVDVKNRTLEDLSDSNVKGKLYCVFCKGEPVERLKKNFFLQYRSKGENYESYITELNLKETQKEIGRFFTPWGLKGSKKSTQLLKESYSYYVWIEALLSYSEQYHRLTKKLKKEPLKTSYFYGKDNSYYHTIVLPNLLEDGDPSSPFFKNNECFKRSYVLGENNLKMSGSKSNYLTLEDLNLDPDIVRFALACLDPLKKDLVVTRDLIEQKIRVFTNKYQNLVKRIKDLKKGLKIQKNLPEVPLEYIKTMERSQLRKALTVVMTLQKEICSELDLKLKEGSLTRTDLGFFYNKTLLILNLLSPFCPRTCRTLTKELN